MSPIPKPPMFIRIVNPFARLMLRPGFPMGPNQLMTIRGRRSGEPRTVGVAVVEWDGRRWVIGTYGDVNWVRNLRTAGQATLQTGRRFDLMEARELTPDDAREFFQTTFIDYVGAQPAIARAWVPDEMLQDPEKASQSRPVFELLTLDPS